MTREMTGPGAADDRILAPLRYPVYRRIWLASLISNLGLLIQGVGAAWAMTLWLAAYAVERRQRLHHAPLQDAPSTNV